MSHQTARGTQAEIDCLPRSEGLRQSSGVWFIVSICRRAGRLPAWGEGASGAGGPKESDGFVPDGSLTNLHRLAWDTGRLLRRLLGLLLLLGHL